MDRKSLAPPLLGHKRHALPDDQWALLAEFFPPRKPARGGPWRDDRLMVDGILWRLRTGAAWRDLPDRSGPWRTVCDRFAGLRRSGLLDRVIERLQLRLNEAGLIDPDLFCIDGTSIRAARAAGGAAKKSPPPGEPADHALGRSRGGFGTKAQIQRYLRKLAPVTDPPDRPWAYGRGCYNSPRREFRRGRAMSGRPTAKRVTGWADELAAVAERIGGRVARAEPRRRAGTSAGC